VVAGAKTAADSAGIPMPMNASLVAPLVMDSADWTSVLTLVNESKTFCSCPNQLTSCGRKHIRTDNANC
jgi:hypothetical protein